MKLKLTLATLLMFTPPLAYAGQVNVSSTSGFGTLSRTTSATVTVLCGHNLTGCGSISITSQLYTTTTSNIFVYSIDYLTGSAGLTFFDFVGTPPRETRTPGCWNSAGGYGVVTGETSLNASTINFGLGVCWFLTPGVENGAAPLVPGDTLTIYSDAFVPSVISPTGSFGAGNFIIGTGGAIAGGTISMLTPASEEPEPGTIVLLLTGAAGLLAFVRRPAA